MGHGVIQDLLLFLATAVVVTPLCRRLRVSPILGYLAAGMLIGPATLGVLSDSDGTTALAQLGVSFLLFMIGLELSFERLAVIRHLIFGLGTLQVLVTGGVIAGVVWLGGLPLPAALVVGLALAFSSTAFVLQALSERDELTTRTGRVAVAVLILQDLAVVPLLVMIPRLGGDGGSILWAVGESLVKALAAMGAIFLVARLALRPFFHMVAATRSPDVFVAAALLVVIGTSFATAAAGLSHVLGAFLAGVMLASTEYRHQIKAHLQPIRGLLIGLFLLAEGMSIDTHSVAAHLPLVAGGTLALLVGKALLLTLLAVLFQFPVALAMQLGLLLAQGGEFAMVVAARAGDNGLISAGAVGLLTAIVGLSMAVTPLLAAAGSWVVRQQRLADAAAHAPDGEASDLENHVIICGFGRVGQTVARILADQGIPFVAVDRDPRHVAELRRKGEPVFFGDIRNLELLKSVGALRARAVVVTIDSGSGREKLMTRIRARFPELRVLVRARDLGQARGLEHMGATAVVPEALEGSLQLAGLALRSLGVPASEVADMLEEYRRGDYARLAEHGRGG